MKSVTIFLEQNTLLNKIINRFPKQNTLQQKEVPIIKQQQGEFLDQKIIKGVKKLFNRGTEQ